MAIEDALFTLITSASTVTAITGSTNFLYPVKLPDNPPFPVIIFNKIADVTIENLSGSSGFIESMFQLDVITKDFTQAKNLVAVLRTLLYGYGTTTTVSGVVVQRIAEWKATYNYEQETQLFRWICDFKVWYGQTLP